MSKPVTYAIDLKTKEHYILDKEGYVPVDWRYVHTKGGWIPNTNGPMEDEAPVNASAEIEIMFNSGVTETINDPWGLYWGSDGDFCDIACYRPVNCEKLA